MSKSLSLTVEDDILRDADEAASLLHVARETFIIQAIRKYSHEVARRRLRNQLRKESKMTAAESLNVLHEFEAIG